MTGETVDVHDCHKATRNVEILPASHEPAIPGPNDSFKELFLGVEPPYNETSET